MVADISLRFLDRCYHFLEVAEWLLSVPKGLLVVTVFSRRLLSGCFFFLEAF